MAFEDDERGQLIQFRDLTLGGLKTLEQKLVDVTTVLPQPFADALSDIELSIVGDGSEPGDDLGIPVKLRERWLSRLWNASGTDSFTRDELLRENLGEVVDWLNYFENAGPRPS